MLLTTVSKGGKPLAGSRKGCNPCGAVEARNRPVKAGVVKEGDGFGIPLCAVNIGTMYNRAIQAFSLPGCLPASGACAPPLGWHGLRAPLFSASVTPENSERVNVSYWNKTRKQALTAIPQGTESLISDILF